MAGARAKVPAKKSPYYSNLIGGAGFTLGSESSNERNVTIQLKDTNLRSLASRGALTGYLSSDSAGATPHATPPSAGVIAGAAGSVTPIPDGGDTVVVKGTLVIDATAEKFKTTTTTVYRIGGVTYTKAPATAIVFSAAHVVTASKFGVVLVQINAAGTVSTKVPASTQAYNSAPLALAALPAPDSGNVALGYIAIANNAGDWTANTDDLTDASDLTTATFVDATEVNVSRFFQLVSSAAGVVNLIVREAGVKTFYVNLILPDGKLVTSSALAFV